MGLLIKPCVETLEASVTEFTQLGKVESVRCERCNELLNVAQKSETVISVDCACGLYKDT